LPNKIESQVHSVLSGMSLKLS